MEFGHFVFRVNPKGVAAFGVRITVARRHKDLVKHKDLMKNKMNGRFSEVMSSRNQP